MNSGNHYHRLKEQIAEIATQHGRRPEEITLVAVSKTATLEQMQDVYHAGCRDFGENRLQDALIKIDQFPFSDLSWHFIGTLQKNKVKKTVRKFQFIHSIDSIELAQKLSQANAEYKQIGLILLQVNISKEKSKHGLSVEECREQFELFFNLPYLEVKGLMTMAPFIQDEKILRSHFAALRSFRDELQTTYKVELPHLSMGMSNDYSYAIAEGATMLRIGTAIFK